MYTSWVSPILPAEFPVLEVNRDWFGWCLKPPHELTRKQLDRQIALFKFFSNFDFLGVLEGRIEKLEKEDNGRYFCTIL